MALKALFVCGDFSGCGYYRCILPAKELTSQNRVEADWSIIVGPDYAKYYDLIILQRSCTEGMLEIAKKIKKNKRPLLYEIDDDLFCLPRSNPAYDFYNNKRKKIAIEIMRLCDGIIVTNEHLKKRIHEWNKRIFVIPNFIDKALFANEDKEGGKLTLGWAGTATHYDDLKIVSPILGQLKSHFDLNLIFLGWKPPDLEEELIPFTDYENYIRNLGKIDIGIAPIVDNLFNKSKSYIKILEYNAKGIPCVASKVENYKKAFDQGAGCLLAKNPKDWIKALSLIIKDDSIREELIAKGKRFADDNIIQKNVYLWENVFKEIMENYEMAKGTIKPELCRSLEESEKIEKYYDNEGRKISWHF